jgi:hypothetical protein
MRIIWRKKANESLEAIYDYIARVGNDNEPCKAIFIKFSYIKIFVPL